MFIAWTKSGWQRLLIGACAGFCLLMCGCRTPEGPGSQSLASVVIKAREPLAVARSVSERFQQAGFKPTPVPANRSRDMRLEFEKQGTAKDTVLYGDWSFSSLWYRARVQISPMQTAAGAAARDYLVTCDVFRVHNRGDRHFEEEQRLKSKRGYFRELLDEAKKRAEAAAPPDQ